MQILSKKGIFEWYMTRFACKNEHQNDMCYNEIGLCAPTIDTILGPMVTQLGGYVCGHLKRKKIFTFTSSASTSASEVRIFGNLK